MLYYGSILILFSFILSGIKTSAKGLSAPVRVHADLPAVKEDKLFLNVFYQTDSTYHGRLEIAFYKFEPSGDSLLVLNKLINNALFKQKKNKIKVVFNNADSNTGYNAKFYEVLKRVGKMPAGSYKAVICITKDGKTCRSVYLHEIDSLLDPNSAMQQDITRSLLPKDKSFLGIRINTNINKSTRTSNALSNSHNRIDKVARKKGLTAIHQERNGKDVIDIYYQDWFAGRYEANKNETLERHIQKQNKLADPLNINSLISNDFGQPSLFSQYSHQNQNKRDKSETKGEIVLTTNLCSAQEQYSGVDNNYYELRGLVEIPVNDIPVIVEGLYTSQDNHRQIKSSYFRVHSMTSFKVYGADHPYYGVMLTNFMNSKLGQSYATGDYETFIQSCALADSMKIPLYTGYSTFHFSSTANMNTFISALNSIDTFYSFDDSYRDSLSVGGSPVISVCIDLNQVPHYELWKYRDTLLNYGGAFDSSIVDSPLVSVRTAGLIGFIYADPAFPFSPADSGIIDTTTVKIRGPYVRALWAAGHFEMRNYYEFIDAGATPPYEISQDVYTISAYLFNKSIPGAVFTPCYQSTIDADYFKPEKQDYLRYTYGYQSLPPYQVIDSVQGQFLTSRIGSYSSYLVNYSQPTLATFTNLYLFDAGMNNRFYDTLKQIFSLANNGTAGYIFPITNDTVTFSTSTRKVTAYRCGDGTYWYRYFTTGDTMYNAYVSFPGYIPANLRQFYKEVAVIPNPGDSLNRSFTLMLVKGGTTDTIYVKGRAGFTIGKSKELDNVLLGQSGGTLTAPSDTFYNCERQVLNSAIDQGIANYHEYLRHFRDSITASFRNYLAATVNEQLQLGYLNQEFNYTIYNYDRAGNLTFTVPPAGSTLLTSATDLDDVDDMRTANTPWLSPAPVYTKKNTYEYNTYNNVVKQQTIDGGLTRFFYDVAGRLIFSQNAKQALDGYYTYNVYDKQSRVVETGEALMGCPYFAPFYPGGGATPACYYGYTDGYGLFASPDSYFIHYLDKEPADSLPVYIRSHARRDVVVTVYDTAAVVLDTVPMLETQQNLRKRVAAVLYYDYIDTTFMPEHAYATHYSYDIDGNVKTLVQDFPELAMSKQRFKRIDYDYDLISGKVNMLSYNRGWPDQFYQRYTYYPGDNRLMEVHSSNDGWIWHKDAAYRYYEHGPLARVELGEHHVQGIDYAYTIQGWLKAVNSDTLNIDMDMGSDGLFGHANQVTSKDAVAYTIDYFNGDYNPITTKTVQHVTPVSLSLYNGNISRQTMAIDTFQRLNKQYMYDQLNRIHSAAYASVDPVYGTLTGLTDFQSRYSYDADGNLQKMVRYGNNGIMDSLTYVYGAVTPNNQLTNVLDSATDVHDNDIKHFTGPSGTPRYRYDPIGNTIGDLVSGQDTIEWNLYNKVVRTVNTGDTTSMLFRYDGAGNRVKKSHIKTVYDTYGPTGTDQENDYYVRDAQGNILAVYHERGHCIIPEGIVPLIMTEQAFWLAEHDIYGSSRLGVKQYYPGQKGFTRSGYDYADTLQLWDHQPWYSLEYQDAIKEDSTNLYGNTYTDMCYSQQTIGQKQYEITDYLGDVLATVSDKRTADSVLGAHVTGQIDTIVSWKPVVTTATDYYPFGMQMPGRATSDTAAHCFDITQTKLVPYFYSQYFQAISGYFLTTAHGTATISVTSGSDLRMNISNTGYVTMDIDSLVPGYSQTLSMTVTGATSTFDVFVLCSATVVGSAVMNSSGTYNITFTPTASSATIKVQLQFPSGTTRFIQYSNVYLPRSDSSVLYHLVTRVCDGDKYHYGFNGQMKDNEWAGAGNHYEYGVRHYDPRIARFNSVDPLGKQFPWYSSYQFAGNTPIQAIDLDGAEEYHYTRMRDNSGKTTGIQLNSVKDIYVFNLKATLSASLGAGEWKPVYDKNPYQSHVVHQTDTKYMDNVYGLMQETNYDESTSYPSYNEAANGTDADFASTSADWAFRIQQGLNNVGEEVRSNGGPFVNGKEGSGGRLGNAKTRNQIRNIGSELKSRGYDITGGGGRFPEEYLSPIGGGRKGGSYVDLTATKDGKTLRINTVDVNKNGTPTAREARNAARIRQQTPGDHLILIPKKK